MVIQMDVKILLVEDVKIAQKLARIILESLQCDVQCVGCGRDAIDAIRIKSYDLILMDLGLPDIDGITVTETIRKLDNGQHVPIVALTAHDDATCKAVCYQVGMDDVVIKPLTNEKALSILQFLKVWSESNERYPNEKS